MSKKNEESYGRGNSTTYGYIVEWKLKKRSAILASVLPYHGVRDHWARAQYSIDMLGNLSGKEVNSLIKPFIRDDHFSMSKHNLVAKSVAEAILACLKTTIPKEYEEHIEWKIVRIKLEQSHKLTLTTDGAKEEKIINDIETVLTRRKKHK